MNYLEIFQNKTGDQQRMTILLMEQSVSYILYIHQPIYNLEIFRNLETYFLVVIHINRNMEKHCYQNLSIPSFYPIPCLLV